MSGSRLYFKGLQLGDYRLSPESLALITTRPQFIESVGGNEARVFVTGANARYECTAQIAFKRGYSTSESSSQFWDRLRLFLKNVKSVMTYGGGKAQFGVLSVVRDPDGLATGTRDITTSTGTVSAGSNVVVPVSPAVDWSGHPYVLVRDTVDPTKYEIIVLDSTNVGGSTVTLDVTQSYTDPIEICRLEWLWTECAMTSRIELPVNGPAPANWVSGVRLTFEGVIDPTNGGLT